MSARTSCNISRGTYEIRDGLLLVQEKNPEKVLKIGQIAAAAVAGKTGPLRALIEITKISPELMVALEKNTMGKTFETNFAQRQTKAKNCRVAIVGHGVLRASPYLIVKHWFESEKTEPIPASGVLAPSECSH